ncbi:helix-hairpin-helix domain-containing protein, partial [Methylobacterium sp. WL103]
PPPRQVGPSVPVPSTAPRRDTALTRPPAPAPMPAPATMPTPAPQPTAEAPAVPQTSPEPRTVAPELDASQPAGRAEVEAAAETGGPRALALVDLNTASVADLNGLRGGGSIGRAIIQRRPYASIDQLLSKRVLSRATYDKIKDQVTVR